MENGHSKHNDLDDEKCLRTNNHKKVGKLLRHLERKTDTSNPEDVKLCIAKTDCSAVTNRT